MAEAGPLCWLELAFDKCPRLERIHLILIRLVKYFYNISSPFGLLLGYGISLYKKLTVGFMMELGRKGADEKVSYQVIAYKNTFVPVLSQLTRVYSLRRASISNCFSEAPKRCVPSHPSSTL